MRHTNTKVFLALTIPPIFVIFFMLGWVQPVVERPPDIAPLPVLEAINYCNMRSFGRVPDHPDQHYWTPQETYDKLYERMSNPLYDRAMLHMPQGWIYTMSSGGWHGVDAFDGPGRYETEEFQKVYARLCGRILAERPGFKITLYTGGQFYSAYSIYGRPRPDNGQGFIGEPRWMNYKDPQDVRGIRDLTVQPWADIGVTGVVFDSGSRFPNDIVKWKRILRKQMKTVGLEAIPWNTVPGGHWSDGSVNWSACEKGVEYHANQRYRLGKPFLETVPLECRGRAFVWLVHMLDPPPTAQEVADMMRRGWTPVVLWRNDALYAAALAIYNGSGPIDGGD